MDKNLSDISANEIQVFYQRVSKNIRQKREAAQMSQLDLALHIGIKSAAFYSNCENLRYGKHFNLEHVYKIAKVLDVDACELLA